VEPSYPFLSTRGQIQLQFDSGTRAPVFGDDPQVATNPGITRFPVADQLDIRRGRVVTTLHLSPEVEISNETNYDTNSNQLSVLDMYLRAQLQPALGLRAGMFKIPYGWEGLRSSRTTNTIEMSDMTRAFSGIRDSGLAFNGHQAGVEWTVGVFQGQGNVWTDLNAGKDIIARVTGRPISTLRLGASTHYGTFVASRQREIPVRRWNLEMQYHEGPWKVEAEFGGSLGYNFVSRRDTAAAGFYATAVYRIDDANDVLISFDRLDPDLDVTDLRFADNTVNARNRLVLGYNFYFDREPEHRIMLNYEFGNEEEGPPVYNSGVRVRYQYAW